MTTRLDVWELLHAGDWACAQGDGGALARVAADLAGQVGEHHVKVARLVANLATRDLDAATSLWGELAASLRRRLGATAIADHQRPASS